MKINQNQNKFLSEIQKLPFIYNESPCMFISKHDSYTDRSVLSTANAELTNFEH